MQMQIDWSLTAKELEAPLGSWNVKKRNQAGFNVSYVEGWHVINEANRIFGFGGWTRETVYFNCASEKPRKIGKDQKDGWGVSYIAKVRIVVDGVVREGTGAGHGIDMDLGQAHESAAKEAETDAMKRAFITFGNPFGLALYDKTGANVSDEQQPDYAKMADDLIEIVNLCTTPVELQTLKASVRFTTEQNALPEDHYKRLAAAYKAKKTALEAPK